MKIIKYVRWALALALLLAVSTGNATISSPPSYTAPGIGAPSWPLFRDINETIQVKKNGYGSNAYWTLTGTGSNASFVGGVLSSYNLGSDAVRYVANFNSAGQLITTKPGTTTTLTNYLQINGSLPAGHFGGTSWGPVSNQLLLKATLLDKNPGNNKPDLVGTFAGAALGFKTQFTGGWAVLNTGLTGGSTGENLWLAGLSSGFTNLVKALDGNNNNGTLSSLFVLNKTITGVVSVASVPVPGAVWLFLTGLMTFLGSRRKSTNASFSI